MALSVTFLGAAQNVTGSRHLIESDGTRVLVDCGMYQERQNAPRNWEPFAVEPSRIESVVLTHAHIDHSGWLPRLVREGFRGHSFASLATAEIVPVVLADAAHLQMEDVEWKRKRHAIEGRRSPFPLEPLYDTEDVELTCRHLKGVDFGVPQPIAPGLTATLLPAGHILGASMILIEQTRTGKTVLFSGDLGRRGRPLVPDPAPPPPADLVLCESTYGDRIHRDQVDVGTQLARVINETVEQGGYVLIPCFAVERAQDLVFHLRELRKRDQIPSLPVFLDSPMAIRLLGIFGHHPEALGLDAQGRLRLGDSPFKLPELKLCATRDDSKRINDHRGPAIVIAGSGMCTGGRIKHHLFLHMENPKNTLLFVGYQASGTLGRQILDGAQEVRLFGAPRPVRLRVEQIHGFSGHADQNGLLEWLGQMPGGPRQVAVVHGGSQVTFHFASLVKSRLGCEVVVPKYGDRVKVTTARSSGTASRRAS